METIQLLGSTLGLGFVAGLRLYATIFALGLAVHFHWFRVPANLEHLQILADPRVLVASGLAGLVEFFSDKIPWVDSLWDSFHTFIRPIGAALLAGTMLTSIDPAVKLILVILCGGMAFTSHSSKAATRLVANHSPEPFSNIALSTAEDLIAPAGLWLAMQHPLETLAIVLLFLAAFSWFAPRIYRMIRFELTALGTWIAGPARPLARDTAPALPAAAAALAVVARHAAGIRCAATETIPGLRHSIGHLTLVNGELVFAARRLFRNRTWRVPLTGVRRSEWKRGIFVNRLVLGTTEGERAFYVFKDVDVSAANDVPLASRVGQPHTA